VGLKMGCWPGCENLIIEALTYKAPPKAWLPGCARADVFKYHYKYKYMSNTLSSSLGDATRIHVYTSIIIAEFYV
jgi:hypothetical protein